MDYSETDTDYIEKDDGCSKTHTGIVNPTLIIMRQALVVVRLILFIEKQSPFVM